MTPATRPGAGYLAAKAAAVRAGRAREARPGPALEALRRRARATPYPASFRRALTRGPTIGLVAEFKRRSPSAGPLAAGESPAAVTAGYLAAGAAALSVLTDREDFGGSLEDLAIVAAGPGRSAPVLRKDFVVDPAAIYEARSAGAAAALLIAGILDDAELALLLEAAADVGLEALVEVHEERELERALAAGAGLLGLNNRDLQGLETDLSVTERLSPRVPRGTVIVAESGVRSAADVVRLRDAGAHSVLVGEALLRLPPTERRALARELAEVPRSEPTDLPVKVCGLTRTEDAALAARLGAAALGVVLAPSPRRVDLDRAVDVLDGVPEEVARVGVFVDPAPEMVAEAVRRCGLDWVQLSGTEPASHGAAVRRAARSAADGRPLRVLKAIHVRRGEDLRAAVDYPADAFLLDAPPHGGRMGGTGRTFDWRVAADPFWPRSRVVLGGGLTAVNLADAVATVPAGAVDVCSGVEAVPGIKDSKRLADFLAVARRATGVQETGVPGFRFFDRGRRR